MQSLARLVAAGEELEGAASTIPVYPITGLAEEKILRVAPLNQRLRRPIVQEPTSIG